MSSLKQLKLREKSALLQQELVNELNRLAGEVERGERTITTLKSELEAVNQKHQERKTTQDDIRYLEDLLKCANRKLQWEKKMATLQKQTPLVLEKLATVTNDPDYPPDDNTRAAMFRALQGIQNAMERLQSLKLD